MEDLGKYFSELRAERGFDYAKIWQDIRLSEAQIKAVEENRLWELGEYGYIKTLIYNYARYLEADTQKVMAHFRLLMPESSKQEFIPQRALKEKKILLSTNFLWTIGILIFVALLGSILFSAHRQGKLKAPVFFEKKSEVAQPETKLRPETEKPDSLRLRMRELSESMVAAPAGVEESAAAKKTAIQDTTDYVGRILGDSPVNVPVN